MFKSLFIQSEENRSYSEKHECKFLDVYFSEEMPARILVQLVKAIPFNVYNLDEDVTRLILSPHFKSHEVYPQIKPSPCHVYMAIPEDDGTWEKGPYKIIDWGILSEEA